MQSLSFSSEWLRLCASRLQFTLAVQQKRKSHLLAAGIDCILSKERGTLFALMLGSEGEYQERQKVHEDSMYQKSSPMLNMSSPSARSSSNERGAYRQNWSGR
jgi:hypothetical protein